MSAAHKQTQPDSPQGDCQKQKEEFNKLWCSKTGGLAVSLGSAEGREALQNLNAATAQTFNKLHKLNTYCVNCTLGQGACLIVAVMQGLGLMHAAWCGPPAVLSKHAVQVMLKFNTPRKVGFNLLSSRARLVGRARPIRQIQQDRDARWQWHTRNMTQQILQIYVATNGGRAGGKGTTVTEDATLSKATTSSKSGSSDVIAVTRARGTDKTVKSIGTESHAYVVSMDIMSSRCRSITCTNA